MKKTTKKKPAKIRHKFPYAYYPKDLVKVGKVPALGDLPEVNFTYRPLDMMQSAEVDALMPTVETYNQMIAVQLKAVAMALVSWDLKKPDPEDDTKAVAVDFRDVEELKLIDPHVMESILDTVRTSQFMAETPKERKQQVKN